MRPIHLVAAMLVAIVLGACEPGGAGGGAHQPASDVHHVWSTSFGNAVVFDAAIRGPHVAVLFNSGAYTLAISHDGGERFESYSHLPRADEYVSTEAGLGGVMVSPSGEVLLVIRHQGFVPNFGPVVSFTLHAFSEETGTYEGRAGDAIGGDWARIVGDRLETYVRVNDGDAFVLTTLDASTGAREAAAHTPEDEPRCAGVAFGPSSTHNAFVATCPDGALTCFANADPRLDSPSSLTPTLRCVSTAALRAPRTAYEDLYAGFAMYDLGGHVFGERPAPSGVERVDFGPGTVLPRERKRVRVPFARYLPLAAPDVDPATARELTRLLHVPPRGEPREPSFPLTPCAGECAPSSSPQLRLGNLLWLLPLEEPDAFFAIYGVSDEAGDHFYLRRVEDRVEVEPSSRTAGGPLEQACARLAACYPGVAEASMQSCIYTFSRMTARTDEDDRAYQAFLATAEDDCDAFLTSTWGAWGGADTCTPGCFGGVAVSCAEGPDGPVSRRNCNELGVDCRVDAASSQAVCGPDVPCAEERRCDGSLLVSCIGEPSAIDCGALGLTCDAEAGGCVVDEPCVDGGATRCDGDVLVGSGCQGDRRAFGFDIDCRRLGLSCDPLQLACGTGGAATCNDGDAPVCDGDRVVYCIGGTLREIDCASIGFATCELVDGVGTCRA